MGEQAGGGFDNEKNRIDDENDDEDVFMLLT